MTKYGDLGELVDRLRAIDTDSRFSVRVERD